MNTPMMKKEKDLSLMEDMTHSTNQLNEHVASIPDKRARLAPDITIAQDRLSAKSFDISPKAERVESKPSVSKDDNFFDSLDKILEETSDRISHEDLQLKTDDDSSDPYSVVAFQLKSCKRTAYCIPVLSKEAY